MIYHRLWMANDHIGWTVGGGNPGRYLVLLPIGQASPIPNQYNGLVGAFPGNPPGNQFHGWDISTMPDWRPDLVKSESRIIDSLLVKF